MSRLGAALVKRLDARSPVAINAVLVSETRTADACIRNISSRGVMLVASAELHRGELVELRRGGQILAGTVKWRRGGMIGLRLIDRIDVAAFLSGAPDFAAPMRLAAAGRAKPGRIGQAVMPWILGHFQYLALILLALVASFAVASLVGQVLAPLAEFGRHLP